jgi:hypothetical protein
MLIALATSQSVFAKDPFHWEFINVDIDLQENGDMLIKETQQYVFDAPYSDLRYQWISLEGVDHIADISVTENGIPFNTKTKIESDQQSIEWTQPVTPPARHTFVLSYRVIGGLKINENGDQLNWKAIFKNHPAPINKTRVTVRLPAVLAGHIQAYQSENAKKLNDQTVEFIHNRPLLAGQDFDISVTFSHGILNVSQTQKPTPVSKAESVSDAKNVVVMDVPKQVAHSTFEPESDATLIFWMVFSGFIANLFTGKHRDEDKPKNNAANDSSAVS